MAGRMTTQSSALARIAVFLALLVLVGRAEQRRLDQPIEEEAAVIATVADSECGDADQAADTGAGHRRDEGSGRDGQQINLAQSHTGAQCANDGIAAAQRPREGFLVANVALDHLGSRHVRVRCRTYERHHVVTFRRGVADD
jgi:hypothetical protein